MKTPLLRAPELRDLETRYAAVVPPLMERAGHAAADFAKQLLKDRRARVLVLAGPGNNGGDALAAARILKKSGIDVVVVGPGDTVPRGDYGLVVDGLFGLVGLVLLPFMSPSAKGVEIPAGAAVPEAIEP